jgi:hypothetical protein
MNRPTSTPIIAAVRAMHEQDDARARDPYNTAPVRRDVWARASGYTTDQRNAAEAMLRGSRLTLED